MTMQVTQIVGAAVTLVFNRRDVDLRVGDAVALLDPQSQRQLILQVHDIRSGDEPTPPVLPATPGGARARTPASAPASRPRARSGGTAQPPARARQELYVARASIRKLAAPDWRPWDGWMPPLHPNLVKLPMHEVLKRCLRQDGRPLRLGAALTGDSIMVDARALAGMNLIAGARSAEVSHFTVGLVAEFLAQGTPCVLFTLRPELSTALAPPLRLPEGTRLQVPVVRLRAGHDLKLDVPSDGLAFLVRLLRRFGLPKLPALYFASRAAQRLARDTPEGPSAEKAASLGSDDLLQLARELEAPDDKVLIGALLSCLTMIKEAGLLARAPAEATPVQAHCQAIRQGGALIIDLAGLPRAARGLVMQRLLAALWEFWASEKADAAQPPALFLEEPQQCLDRHSLDEVLRHTAALGLAGFIVTTRPAALDAALMGRLDNLFAMPLRGDLDVRWLARCGFAEPEIATALMPRVGQSHGLLVGPATQDYPLMFALALDDAWPSLGERRAQGLAASASSGTALPAAPIPAHPWTAPAAAEAAHTLPLFPDEPSPGPAASPRQPPSHGRPAAQHRDGLSLADIVAGWDQLVKRLGRRRRILETILSTARPARLVAHTLILEFPPQSRFQQELLAAPEYRTPVEEELASLFGVALEVTAVVQPDLEAPRRRG
jgi:hypothetical protein